MNINGVEIFATGNWNGDEFSSDDLDAMIEAFPVVGFQVPLKLGHDDTSGAPAYGWVSAIRRKGDKLVADFTDIGPDLYAAIKSRRYDAVSAEIFFNLHRNGMSYRRVLKAVALLGAEIPAVSYLAPIHTALRDSPVI